VRYVMRMVGRGLASWRQRGFVLKMGDSFKNN
jgi:hypothetical protein